MRYNRTSCIVGLVLGSAFSLRGDVISMGSLLVQTSTNIFLPTTATGDACLTGVLGGSGAGAADFRSPVLAATGFGGAAGCTNQFVVRSANQPSIFFTFYDLKNYGGFEGNTPAAKFPAPVTADALIQAKSPPVMSTFVFTAATGQFVSSELSVAGAVLFRSAKLTSDASVDTSLGQAGVATARTFDPWIFTPESDTMLTLQVILQDVHLQADPDTAAILLVDGAFGMGSTPGQNTLLTFNEGPFIGVTGGTLDISSRVLVDNTGSPLTLLSGDTYWLTADIETGAASALPEPSFLWVVAAALGVFLWRRPRRAS